MAYIISTNGPGDEATFRAVSARLDSEPDGLVALYAGAGGAGLSITAVWESKAQSDRFAAEQLLPALRQVVPESGPPTAMIEFETFDHVVAARTTR